MNFKYITEWREKAVTNDEVKNLALELLKADSEDEVIAILKNKGYWNDPKVWRLIGDREGNYAVIGNQQSRPEAALTEKIINSIDARLMCECLARGVGPESSKAPKSLREAVAQFFESKENYDDFGGIVQTWDNKKRREVSEGITVAVTGERRNPCLTVADIGEGQTPDKMPDTFLSIDRQNKLSIFFVQGKFNMGGTGVLEFCGTHNLQLILTKRNPDIIKAIGEHDASNEYWGITIVRIQNPTEKTKNSVYTYLAPIEAESKPFNGKVLRFKTESLPVLPQGNEAYVREIGWGSVIKMYNYDMKGFSSHACMKDGLLYRIEAMLPEPALPVRIYECRDFKGHAGSFATTLAGLKVRLEDNKAENLEEEFPDSVPFKAKGEEMIAQIYAFKKGKADTYRTNEGIIFTINGQTHGAVPKTFFSRNNVKMGRLADSLLILIDCSNISNRAREKLFMNSRDRLRNGELRKALEAQLEDIVHRHEGLRKLREQRRSREIAERLDDAKPLEEILNDILKSSPSLASLFSLGNRLSKPYKQKTAGGKNGKGDGTDKGEQSFKGNLHPTFFKFKKKQYGEILRRNSEVGRRCRIDFETDVENNYFSRSTNQGRFILKVLEEKWHEEDIDWSITLRNGVAHLSIDMPDNMIPGEEVTFEFTVADDVILNSFVNIAILTARPKLERPGRGTHKPDKKFEGTGEKIQPTGIQLPKINRIHEENWNAEFDQYSACSVIQDENEQDESEEVYEFNVNVDNIYLRTDMKHGNEHPRLMEDKFVYGNVLIGLGLIKDYREREKKASSANSEVSGSVSGQSLMEQTTVEQYVSHTTRALSPLLLPMINTLGALSEEDIKDSGQIGDDE